MLATVEKHPFVETKHILDAAKVAFDPSRRLGRATAVATPMPGPADARRASRR